MKAWIICILGLTLLSGVCAAQEAPTLEDEKERINYSVGYQVGGDFKRQGLEIDPEVMLRGMQDAFAEKEPLMTPKEMRSTLVELKKRITAGQKEQQREAAEKNLTEGRAFLAENGKKEGVTTLPSGLQYRVLAAGKGEAPKATDTVTAHYRGTLIDGTEFDSSYHRDQPATFRADRVIEGWKEALQMMKPGAKYELFIPPELAYGQRGLGSLVGPNSTLIFEVELISVQPEEEQPPQEVEIKRASP